MKNINLNLLETFFTVYKLRSYTKAAKMLGKTVTGIVNHIQKIELEREKKLFIKTGGCLSPTEEAQRIYNDLYQHFHSLELALRGFNCPKEKKHLDIITSTGESLLWLMTDLYNFSLENNTQHYNIHTTEQSHLTDPKSYDVIALPQNNEYPGYKMIPVASFCTKLYASKEYIAKFGCPLTAEDLDHHRIISFYNRSDTYRGDPDWALRVGRPQSNPREAFITINNAMGIGKAASLGIGIAALTDNNPYIELSQLTQVLPNLSSLPSTLYIGYNILLANNEWVRSIEKRFASSYN
jgi:DNA-binding transcriptional LysR family regulator